MPPLDESSNSTLDASLDSNPVDDVAELLLGGEEDEIVDDTVEEEAPPNESNEDNDSSEEAEGTEEEEIPTEPDEEDATWAATLGVDEDQLVFTDEGEFSGINVKVNGQTSQVKMEELVAGYQSAKSFTQKSQAFAEERRVFEADKADAISIYQQKLENVESLTGILGKQLTREFDSVNWNQLRVDNPAEYAAMRQDYASRANEIQQSQHAIAAQKQDTMNQNSAVFQQNKKAYMAEQYNTMISNNPSWSDKDTHKADMDSMKSFMSDQYGFRPQDFNGVEDARLIEVMKDAKAYRDGAKTVAKKLQKKVPRFQKSKGNKRFKKVSKLDRLTKQAKHSTGSNQRSSQVDAIAELLG